MYEQGHLAILKGNLVARRLRRQDHRPEEPVDHRPGARVRFRERLHGGDHGEADQGRRRDRDPLRGPEGRPGHAGDAGADLGADRPGAGRIGRPAHRRALLRRHLGHGGRATSRRRPTSAAPIALVKEGDSITIDAKKRLLQLNVPAKELAARRKKWKPPKPRYTRGRARQVHEARVDRLAAARSPTPARSSSPGRFRNSSSSGVLARPRIALRWGKRPKRWMMSRWAQRVAVDVVRLGIGVQRPGELAGLTWSASASECSKGR